MTRFSLSGVNGYSQSNSRKYLLGLYYSIMTITTVGFGDITPRNNCSCC